MAPAPASALLAERLRPAATGSPADRDQRQDDTAQCSTEQHSQPCSHMAMETGCSYIPSYFLTLDLATGC